MAKRLMVTPPFVNYRGFKQIHHLVFSGGVSEHVYDRDSKAYGDIGPVLGSNMREYLKKLPKEVLREPIEGNSRHCYRRGRIYYSGQRQHQLCFQLKAIASTWLEGDPGGNCAKMSPSETALRQALAKFDLPHFTSGLALSLTIDGQPDYQSVAQVSRGHRRGLAGIRRRRVSTLSDA